MAAVATAIGVLTLVQALTPPEPPTTPVVVASRDVPGGTEVTADDLAVVQVPNELVPDAALADPSDATGRVLTATTPRGVPVTLPALLTPHALSPGRALAPVRFADSGLVQVLRVGDRIDIVAAGPDVGEDAVVASDVRVVTIPTPEGSSGLGGGSGQGVLVLVEVTTQQASMLAQMTSRAALHPVVR